MTAISPGRMCLPIIEVTAHFERESLRVWSQPQSLGIGADTPDGLLLQVFGEPRRN